VQHARAHVQPVVRAQREPVAHAFDVALAQAFNVAVREAERESNTEAKREPVAAAEQESHGQSEYEPNRRAFDVAVRDSKCEAKQVANAQAVALADSPSEPEPNVGTDRVPVDVADGLAHEHAQCESDSGSFHEPNCGALGLTDHEPQHAADAHAHRGAYDEPDDFAHRVAELWRVRRPHQERRRDGCRLRRKLRGAGQQGLRYGTGVLLRPGLHGVAGVPQRGAEMVREVRGVDGEWQVHGCHESLRRAACSGV